MAPRKRSVNLLLCVWAAVLAVSCETAREVGERPRQAAAAPEQSVEPAAQAPAEPVKGEAEAEALYLEGSAFRKVSPSDPGTVLIYIGNAGNSLATLKEARFNGEELVAVAPADGGYVYWQVRPQEVPGGKVSELAVKLSQPRVGLLNVAVSFAGGGTLNCTLAPRQEPLVITSVGFSRPLDTAYLYVENAGETPVTLRHVWREREEVTERAKVLDPSLAPGQKTCVVFRPQTPFRPGEEVFFKVDAEEGVGARALVKAFNLFPVTAWDRPAQVDGEALGFDSDEAGTGLHLREVLACPMHAHGSWAQAARLAVDGSLAGGGEPGEPGSFINSIYVCRFQFERGLPLFGSICDVLSLNPNQDIGSKGPRSRSVGYLTDLGRQSSAPRPIVTSFRSSLGEDEHSYPEVRPSAEEIRLQAYCAIAHGSKGIGYPLAGVGEESRESIVRLNAELASIKRYLAVADVWGAPRTDDEKVEAAALLAGDEAMVVVVVNHDYTTSEGAEEKALSYVARRGVGVEVPVPSWFTVGKVLEVAGGELKEAEGSVRNGSLHLALEELAAPRLFLVTVRK